MQAGSTGLGTTVLVLKVAQESEMTRLPPTSPPEGALVIYCKTTAPVIWNIWIAVDSEEVPALLAQLLKPRVLWYVCKALISGLTRPIRALVARDV